MEKEREWEEAENKANKPPVDFLIE